MKLVNLTVALPSCFGNVASKKLKINRSPAGPLPADEQITLEPETSVVTVRAVKNSAVELILVAIGEGGQTSNKVRARMWAQVPAAPQLVGELAIVGAVDADQENADQADGSAEGQEGSSADDEQENDEEPEDQVGS